MALDNEQHFILRVQNPELANTLRAWLRDKANIEGDVRLLFESRRCCLSLWGSHASHLNSSSNRRFSSRRFSSSSSRRFSSRRMMMLMLLMMRVCL